MTMPDRETMMRAFLQRDTAFEGIFFTGVRTTGIFCRPTCSARKPREENVTFFATARAALANGFRPCKICRPMETVDDPPWVRSLVQALERSEGYRLSDGAIRELGIDPTRARRWFQRHHGITFQSFARQLRITRAYGAIRDKASVTEAAFANGYESLSGFEERFSASAGFSPGKSRERSLIVFTRVSTPLGPMVAAAVDDRLCLLEFADRPMLETQLARIQKRYRANIVAGSSSVFARLHEQLEEYFAGTRSAFDLPLSLRGTEFQERVWHALLQVKHGETTTYARQAAAIGRPKAIRAVARANGDNRLSIVVPCHRVIGSDGSLTGYGGGLWRKRYLIDLENGTLN